jgi:threonine aldolase
LALSAPAVVADFRSDTVTQPCRKMREAMAAAAVGDDVYGEDPTVARLEQHAAELLGKEAALFVASGTMGNLLSIGAVCNRGDELLVADKSHINNYEAGGASVLLGAKLTPLPTGYGTASEFGPAPSSPTSGVILPEQVTAAVHGASDPHYAPTRMLCLENTNVTAGGNVLSLEIMRGVCERYSIPACVPCRWKAVGMGLLPRFRVCKSCAITAV